jgi:hypothetical protein
MLAVVAAVKKRPRRDADHLKPRAAPLKLANWSPATSVDGRG